MQIEQLAKMPTVKTAMQKLGVNKNRVYQYIEDGRLKAIKFGRDWYIDPESLQRLMETPRQAGNPNFKKTA